MQFSKITILSFSIGIVLNGPVSAADAPPIVHSGIVEAPVEQVWDAFTTSKDLESWMAPHAEIELKIGGLMRSNYHADGVLGDENTIVNVIQSYQPQRMLSIKVAQAPEKFPFKHAVQSMWTVLLFEPVSPQQTRLTVTGMGFTDDEESQRMRQQFDAGNKYTLNKLQEHFTTKKQSKTESQMDDGEIVMKLMHDDDVNAKTSVAKRDDSKEVLKLLHTQVGGEWIAQTNRPDGSVLRARKNFAIGPDGESLVISGWLGDSNGMSPHGSGLIWREPGAGEIRFQNIDQVGAIAAGAIHATADKTISWDWNATALNGHSERYRVDMIFENADHNRFKLFVLDESKNWKPLIDLQYTRTREVPAEFLKIKSEHR